MGFLKQHWQKLAGAVVVVAALGAGFYYGWPLIKDIFPGDDDDTITTPDVVISDSSPESSAPGKEKPNDGLSPLGIDENNTNANPATGMANQTMPMQPTPGKNSDSDIMSQSANQNNIYSQNMAQGSNYEAGQNKYQPQMQPQAQSNYNQGYNQNYGTSTPITLGGPVSSDYELSLLEQKIKELKLQINHMETQLKYKKAKQKQIPAKPKVIVLEGNQAKVYDTAYYKNISKAQKKQQQMINRLTKLRQSVHTLNNRVKKLEQKLSGPLNN